MVSRATGKPVLETFEERTANAVNLERYEVLPIREWLGRVNKLARRTVI